MNELVTIIFSFLIFLLYKLYQDKKLIEEKTKQIYSKQLDLLQVEVNLLRENKIDPRTIMSLSEHERIKTEYNFKLNLLKDEYENLIEELKKEKNDNSTLKSQRQSNHVKLGRTVEHFYPLLSEFPYDRKECSTLLQPIDMVFWGEQDKDDVVFIEIKSGNSQLSTKQKRIKNAINNKQVRFETHRINEKGIIIK